MASGTLGGFGTGVSVSGGSSSSGKDANGVVLTNLGGFNGGELRLAGASLATATSAYSKSKAKWLSQVAAQAAGTAGSYFDIMGNGDSLESGFGSLAGTTGNTLPGARDRCQTSYMAAILASLGYNANAENTLGDQGVGASSATWATVGFDPRMAPGSWVSSNSQGTLGGSFIRATTATGGSLVYTPYDPIDTVDFYYPQASSQNGNGYFLTSSSANNPFNNNSASANGQVSKITVNGTLGDTIKATYVGGTLALMGGFIGYRRTLSQMRCLNGGAGHALSADLANVATGYTPPNVVIAINPAVVFLSPGKNDFLTGVSIPTYTANLQTIINLYLAAGIDVICETVTPSNVASSGISLATQETYANAMISVANSYGLLCIDRFHAMGSQEKYGGLSIATSQGFGIYNNQDHPQWQVYQEYAASRVRALLSLYS